MLCGAPRILLGLKDADVFVQRNAAVLVREVVKHSEELANIAVRAGAAPGLVEYINATTGTPRLAAVMALGASLLHCAKHPAPLRASRPDTRIMPPFSLLCL
jgi:hypothetical protein